MSGHVLAVLSGLGAMGWRRVGHEQPQGLADHLYASKDGILCWLLICAALIVAYLTNPNDAAFRSFITDMSFQSHLNRLRSAAAKTAAPSDSHVLNFSNRIAISLRTPPYALRSFGVFTTVTMIPHGYPLRGQASKTADLGEAGSEAPFGSRSGLFIGAFGRWWTIDDGSSEDGRAEKDRLASSVMAMEAVDVKPAAVESAKETSKPPKHRQPSSSRPANRNAVLSTRARTSSSSTEPPAVEAPTDLFSTKTEQHLPGLPFHTRDAAPASDIAPAPATTLPSAVLELQTQLNDLRTTTTATETRLHSDLEALKTRKKDEEAARVELKARGKASEEVKRAAEHEHAEAEKRLHTVRAGRQTALNAVHHADTELNRLDKRFADLTAKRERSATNRLEREETLRSEVEQRQLDLKDAEVKAKALANKVEGLETSIEQRKLALYARLMQPQMMRHPPGFAPHLPSGPWGPDRITPSYVPPVPQNRSPSLGLDFSHVNMPSVQTSSFLEHRIQHLSDHHAPANSAFSPFGPSMATSIPLGGTASRGIPLPFFSPPPMDDGDPLMTAAMDDGEAARRHMRESTPLSPMTPNHRTLIPSTLFDMLEDDGDLPASPILARHSQPTNNFPWPAPAPTQALPPAIGGMRHPLALNPDAKAFSFNRPLPRQQVSPVIEGEKEVEAAAAGWTGFSPFD